MQRIVCRNKRCILTRPSPQTFSIFHLLQLQSPSENFARNINPNLGEDGGLILPPCLFSLNNSETVKAVTLAFWSIQSHFIRDIRTTFDIPNSPQSPNIGQKSNGGISNFRISGQSLMNENCHNSRTSDDITCKLGSVTKINKRNKTTSKKFDDGVMSKIVTSLSFLQFMVNLERSGSQIPDA